MMPVPYSIDLRQKAIAAIEAGQSKVVVSQLLGIARSTLTERHNNQYRRSGEVAPKQGYQQGHSHKITDRDAFRAFAKAHGDKAQAEMVQLWPDEMSAIQRGESSSGLASREKKTYVYTKRDSKQR